MKNSQQSRKKDAGKRNFRVPSSNIPAVNGRDLFKREEHFKIAPKHPGKGRR